MSSATIGLDVLGPVTNHGGTAAKLREPEKGWEQMDKLFAADMAETDEETLNTEMVPVHFKLPNSEAKPWKEVTVVGSWTHEPWLEHFKLLKKGGSFAGWVDMPVGTHRFKFIADGEWFTSDAYPLETDEAGNENNIVNVVSSSAVASQTPFLADAAKQVLFAVAAPFRFAFRVLFSPLRLLLRLFGLM